MNNIKLLINTINNYKGRIEYKSFSIPKKNGMERLIHAPVNELKKVQNDIKEILEEIYNPPKAVQAFITKKQPDSKSFPGIKKNASLHIKQRSVLNIDLKDFFPSITFPRVVGLFKAPPFNFSKESALKAGRILTLPNDSETPNCLPQGAPTSPVISNMICYKMDRQLMKLAQEHKCTYSRYADDITLSSHFEIHPLALKKNILDKNIIEIFLDNKLKKIINGNKFTINKKKIRFYSFTRKQEVTGLTVNRFVNIPSAQWKKVNSMLYAWEKHGLEPATDEFFSKFDDKLFKRKFLMNTDENESKYYDSQGIPRLGKMIQGRLSYIRHIRTPHNNRYLSFRNRLINLSNAEFIKYFKNDPPELPYCIARDYNDLIYQEKTVILKLMQLAAFLEKTAIVLLYLSYTTTSQITKIDKKKYDYKGIGSLNIFLKKEKSRIEKNNLTDDSYYEAIKKTIEAFLSVTDKEYGSDFTSIRNTLAHYNPSQTQKEYIRIYNKYLNLTKKMINQFRNIFKYRQIYFRTSDKMTFLIGSTRHPLIASNTELPSEGLFLLDKTENTPILISDFFHCEIEKKDNRNVYFLKNFAEHKFSDFFQKNKQ